SEGASQSHTFTFYDKAGNSATVTIAGINIDETARPRASRGCVFERARAPRGAVEPWSSGRESRAAPADWGIRPAACRESGRAALPEAGTYPPSRVGFAWQGRKKAPPARR